MCFIVNGFADVTVQQKYWTVARFDLPGRYSIK